MARWGAGWKRDWWRVARSIRTEAQVVQVKGEPLNDLLYIPPPFRKDREHEIHAEWDSFARPLATGLSAGGHPYGFILAELKAVDRTEYGYKLQLRNMAKPIFIDEQMYAQVAKNCPLGLALLPRQKEVQCSIVALLLVEGTGKGNLRAKGASLMLTNKHYIPVNTIHELQLANVLCDSDRVFTRGVGKHVGADFVLRDTTPPTAMLIYSLVSLDYLRNREAVAESCAQAGCINWKWDVGTGQPMPTLPAISQ